MRNLKVLSLSIVLAVSVSCGARIPVIQTPATPISQAQQLQLSTVKSLATLAELNKAATATAINLNRSKILTDEQTRQILSYNAIVSSAVRTAFSVMDNTKDDRQKSAAVLALLKQLQLPSNVQSILDTPGSDMAMASLISITKSMITIVEGLQGAR